MEEDAGNRRFRKPRWGTLALVALGHLAVIAGLAQIFAPQFTASVVNDAVSVFTVNITAPQDPPPPPPAEASPLPDEGASGEQGRRATPRDAAIPRTPLPINPQPVPPVASTGDAVQSGASETGSGTGGANAGEGTGSGQSGSGQGAGGQGNGGRRKLEKTAGDINSARDYPKKTRDLRIGHSVTIQLTVGTDGSVTDCRVTEASPDAEADAITCRLATERFRFNPATDAQGNPVSGRYSWRQRWFY